MDQSAPETGGRFDALAAQLARARSMGRSFVIVSSGAVALGRARLGASVRPRKVAELQACAAIGQSRLMRSWEDAFAPHTIAVAQMLLSHDDLEDRARYLNARAALDALFEMGAVPVINENDTVAVDEIRFGDNDQLAAMVGTLAGAELLILLTDVDGLLDPGGGRISRVDSIADARAMVSDRPPDSRALGSGGMASKLEAARRASHRGIPVVIANAASPNVITAIVEGEDVGTVIVPEHGPLPSRKHWIAFTLRPRGDILLDDGAARAVLLGGRSLLFAGVVGVRGHFAPGDAVVLRDPKGEEIARGLTRYGTEDVAKLAGAASREIEPRLGYHGGDEVVHRDDLVVRRALGDTSGDG